MGGLAKAAASVRHALDRQAIRFARHNSWSGMVIVALVLILAIVLGGSWRMNRQGLAECESMISEKLSDRALLASASIESRLAFLGKLPEDRNFYWDSLGTDATGTHSLHEVGALSNFSSCFFVPSVRVPGKLASLGAPKSLLARVGQGAEHIPPLVFLSSGQGRSELVYCVPVSHPQGWLLGLRSSRQVDALAQAADSTKVGLHLAVTGSGTVYRASANALGLEPGSSLFARLRAQGVHTRSIREAMEEGRGGRLRARASSGYAVFWSPVKTSRASEPLFLVSVVSSGQMDQLVRQSHGPSAFVLLVVAVIIGVALALSILDFHLRQVASRQELEERIFHNETLGCLTLLGFQKWLASGERSGYLVSAGLYQFWSVSSMFGLDRAGELLRQGIRIFAKHFRWDESFGHLYKDQFVFFLKEDSPERMRERLAELGGVVSAVVARSPLMPEVHPVFGCAPWDPALGFEKCFARADACRLNATVGNPRFFSAREAELREQWAAVEQRFERDLRERRFVPVFQPQCDSASGAVLGAEVLVRRRADNGTLENPAGFVPVYERTGQIVRLDEQMFRMACEFVKRRREVGGREANLAANLSRASLLTPGVAERYEAICRSCGVATDAVALEITESMAANRETLIAIVESFYRKGFRMHLDDFGSGYSSLDLLRRMHLELVKIDKSLVDGIGDINGERLLRHIVQLCHEMDLRVVAEGVTHDEQLEFMRDIGCTMIQGAYFSMPVSEETFLQMLRDGRVARSGASSGAPVHLRRTQIQRILRDERYPAEILENQLDGIVFCRLQGDVVQITQVNERWCSMLGIGRLERVPSDSRPLVWPDDYSAFLAILERARRTIPAASAGEVRCLRTDGKVRWLHVTAYCLRETGQGTEFYTLVRDVSESHWSVERLKATVSLMHVSLWDWDFEGHTITFRNPAGRATVHPGLPFLDAPAMVIPDFPEVIASSAIFPSESRATLEGIIEQCSANRRDEFASELALNQADGSQVWVRIRGILVRDANGNPLHGVGSVANITQERREHFRNLLRGRMVELLRSLVVYEMAIDLTRDTVQHESSVRAWLKETGATFGAGFDANIAWVARTLVDDEFREPFLAFFNRDRLIAEFNPQAAPDSLDYRRRYRGNECWMRATRCLTQIDGTLWMYLTLSQIPSPDRQEDLESAGKDPLTGLVNSRVAEKRIGQFLAQEGRPPAILVMADLDGFKSVNDTRGHLAGNQVLRELAALMTGFFGPKALIGRFGGDEFVLLLTDSRDLGEVRLGEFVQTVQKHFVREGTPACITISLGWVWCPAGKASFNQIVQMADEALYRAKDLGRNRAVQYSTD